ncbi:hypothetical protein ACQKLP_26165 [Chitinophaga sp. NPDC101104]|uniref:hypothetical protein n=1 Tax=Chitinophaga sp. NPDC101104 TaxID=3390561 RepID=UPI003D05C4DF
MKNGYLLFLTAASLLLFSCKKKDKLSMKGALVFYETQCSDPWRGEVTAPGTEGFVQNLELWLEKETGAAIDNIKRIPPRSNLIVCDACTCSSGYKLLIWPAPGSEQPFIDLGFSKPQ